nr:MAG TPA: hypothetical protein [Caudoviricetes sp.]DAI14969.1 MAG TPA: hypothetical protein [Caudoviricetes sp.]DAT21098.1 MAG TPA: hypothetical protein [Caudoviricetes sp.]
MTYFPKDRRPNGFAVFLFILKLWWWYGETFNR